VDVFRRASALFDEVVVAVGVNAAKKRLFTDDERLELLAEATADLPNVSVAGFSGLVTDFCREQGAVAIVKGLRGPGDYEYELPMAQMNSALTAVETVFLTSAPASSFVSSSLVKEVASLGGDVSPFVPSFVLRPLLDRLGKP
jgi:pantetheine-phosphate adenylyltransferase